MLKYLIKKLTVDAVTLLHTVENKMIFNFPMSVIKNLFDLIKYTVTYI